MINKNKRNRTAEYKIWCSMKNRCNNSNDKVNYSKYGAKGIKVCKQWEDSFAQFIADMGLRPTSSHSIDRIDSTGNYEPKNCRWATTVEQARNRTNNRIIEFRGESLCLQEWARRLGLHHSSLNARLGREGWSLEEALTKKKDIHSRVKRYTRQRLEAEQARGK